MPAARTLLSPTGRPLPAGCTIAVGHRGARAFAPENTLSAFAKARQLGCDMVELDVHLSRDGELMVHHDDRLARCTDLRVRFPQCDSDFVSDFPATELRALDAGSWYVRELELPAARRQASLHGLTDLEIEQYVSADDRALYATGQIRIPTLDEVLDLARRIDLLLDIEIKSIPRLYEGIAAKVVDRVRAARMQRSVLVSSFDHEQLPAVRRLDADIATGVLTSDRLARPADYLRLLDADAYLPGCRGDVDSLGFGSVRGALDARGIAEVLAAGRMVFPWTCNAPEHMAALCSAGVTGIITDYPNRFPGGPKVGPAAADRRTLETRRQIR
jgi:glycerophosphoryl diester phosphodiesterase